MKKVFITGVAGFIGSNLADALLNLNYNVVGWDNFSTGKIKFLENAYKNKKFSMIVGDNKNFNELKNAMAGCDIVFHLAANADVRFGLIHPQKDLQENTLATSNVLEAMRENEIKTIVFSSTGSVYGEAHEIPTPEHTAFPIQTSLYGASKLACEALIQAYCEGFGFKSYIFRFVSILGERYTHGHVFDFYKQLLDHPDQLTVLGDGKQKKSYLYVQDCVNAIIQTCLCGTSNNKINIYNLGTNEFVEVNDSIQIITEYLNISPKICYTGGYQGWIGDNPFIFLETKKIRDTGWNPHLTIKESIIATIKWLEQNKWVYEK